MGVRHAQGICNVPEISELFLVDKFDDALKNAREKLIMNKCSSKIKYILYDDFRGTAQHFDIAILATPAQDRLAHCILLIEKGAKTILIEKPLGQSLDAVNELNDLFKKHPGVKAFVNLSKRLFDVFKQLKNELHTLPQCEGEKTITINTGAMGIGANGIHYLDLLFFLFDADDAKIDSCKIDTQLIPSGRGAAYADFGGWAVIGFYKTREYLGKALISMSPKSSVYGGWDIVCSHGRITLNEGNGKRVDYFRKKESEMPVQRYHSDYEAPVETNFEYPALADLTKLWFENLLREKDILPEIKDSLKVHQLMFDWLSASETHQHLFPVT